MRWGIPEGYFDRERRTTLKPFLKAHSWSSVRSLRSLFWYSDG